MNFNPTTLRPTVKSPAPTAAQQPPERLGHEVRAVALAAANVARRRYPGVVGQLLASEIDAYLQFGYRTSFGSLVPKLIAELTQPAP